MGDGARAEKADIGGEGDVAGNALPDVVEGVDRGPDVGAASADAIFRSGGVELRGAGAGSDSGVGVVVEGAH